MVYKITFKHTSGELDEILIEGDSIEEVREKMLKEVVEKRGAKPMWSDKVS